MFIEPLAIDAKVQIYFLWRFLDILHERGSSSTEDL